MSTYYDKLLLDNRNNVKKTWSTIKYVINKKKKGSSTSSTVTDNITIAKHLNKYFVNVASEHATKISKSKTDPTKTIKKIPCVCKEEVSKIIMYLNNSIPGWDNFQSNVIKDTSDLLLLPLTHLLNLSITQGVFPDELKIAKVIPIFQKW